MARWVCGGLAVLVLAAPTRSAAEALVRYRTAIQGVEDKALRRKLEAASVTYRQRRVGVRDIETLAWRVGRDAETLRELLMAEGYRRAAVSAAIETVDHRRRPLRLTLRVTPGERYHLRDVMVVYGDVVDAPLAARIAAAAQALEGLPAQAERIVHHETLLRDLLRDAGHPDARIGPRRVRVFHQTVEVDVVYRLYAGPQGRFGETRIEGLASVKPRTVERKIPWNPGDRFQLAALETARQRLLTSDLFLSVRVQDVKIDETPVSQRVYGPEPEPLAVPIRLSLRERRHRSVGMGLHYYSDDGPAARLFWEHRNVRGHGERLRLETRYSGFLSDFRTRYTIPDFKRLDQTLSVRLHWEDERTDVFESRRWDVETRLERRLSQRFFGGVGTGFLMAEVREPNTPYIEYELAYFPLSLTFDARDHTLHPTRGLRSMLRVVPYVDVRAPDQAAQFYKNHVQLEAHQSLIGGDRLGLAWRGTGGVILGAELTQRVPIDQRFYSGGGGSVRGYAYQRLGPERNGRPTGGRSLAETSLELRSRIGDSWGAVLFLDGGMAFSEMLPETLAPMRWGAGLGARWFTGVGPLRVDLAFPLQRRTDIDSPFAIYIGLGQAF